VDDVERKGLKAALLRRHGVVGAAEMDAGSSFGPPPVDEVGVVSDMERERQQQWHVWYMQMAGKSCRQRGVWVGVMWCGQVTGVKEEEVRGKGTQVAKVINREWNTRAMC
jgi:hypothetical protein